MPFIETPDDLAEAIADWRGVYGAHEDDEAEPCRCCYVSEITDRIRNAVKNETNPISEREKYAALLAAVDAVRAKADYDNCDLPGHFLVPEDLLEALCEAREKVSSDGYSTDRGQDTRLTEGRCDQRQQFRAFDL